MANYYKSLEEAHADGWVSWLQAQDWAYSNGLLMREGEKDRNDVRPILILGDDGTAIAASSLILITGHLSSLGGRFRSYRMFPREALKITSEEV